MTNRPAGEARTTATTTLRRACGLGALVAFIPFVAVLWNVRWDPLRGATAGHLNGNFYDLQARALFHGHLSVPDGSLGIEGFVVDGRTYMYFGPFPALLRMPVLLVTSRFDGRLTAPSMLIGFVLLAVALTLLVERVRARLRPVSEIGRLEAAAVGIFVASVLGGTAIVFLASQPWVYHEVYIWSSALAVGTLATIVAAWDAPTPRRTVTAGVLATATMLTRLPAGWSVSLALAGTGLWLALRRCERRGWGLVGAALVALTAGSVVNWLKFRHVYMFPIDKHVWTQYSPHRRLVLFQNGGRIDGPQFFWTDLVGYFRPDGVRFTRWFPFVTFPDEPPAAIWGVHLDESFRTGSLTALSPLLVGLAIWGVVVAVRPRGRPGIASLRIPLLGAIGVTGGVMAFGYIAPRYLAEFVPALALAGAIGLFDVATRLSRRATTWRRTALAAMAVLAAYGVVANTSPAVLNAARASRGDSLERLVTWQQRLSTVTGNPLDGNVVEVDALPDDGPADQLAVVGECDALYLATGETSAAWIPVAVRSLRIDAEIGTDGTRSGTITLATFEAFTHRRLELQSDRAGEVTRVRLVAAGVPPELAGAWLEVAAGDVVRIDVRAETAANRFVATAEIAGATSTVELPMTEWDRRLHSVNITPAVSEDLAGAARAGMRVTARPGPAPDVCRTLVD